MRYSLALLAVVPLAASASHSAVNTTTCNGQQYTYQELAGYGFIKNNARDTFSDTIGGIGSSVAVDRNSWVREGDSYTGLMYSIPDRGWNTEGSLLYHCRIHKHLITFTPNASASLANPSPANIHFRYLDTILLTDPAGKPVVGLDAGLTGPYLKFPGFDIEFPSANYTGDGFGGDGPGGGPNVVLDAEGLVLGNDGSYWISDEYADYIYNFNLYGRIIGAIRPPAAFIPQRNGSQSFTSDNPPRYDLSLRPTTSPTSGRSDNQGLEGLTVNMLGTKLYALTQSALMQDSGSGNPTTRNARMLVYNIAGQNRKAPKLEAEYVVPLNNVVPGNSTSNTARQSELHYISDTQFLTLARDSGAGRGQGENTTSIYRQIDVFDITNATNIAGKSDCLTCSIAPEGILNRNTTAAEYCSWLDFNVNSQLNRFGVRNGGEQSDGLLNEKWESIALLPVNPATASTDGQYYVLSLSDNDFITQDGHLMGGRFTYADSTGYSLDTQALMFKVQLPQGVNPLIG